MMLSSNVYSSYKMITNLRLYFTVVLLTNMFNVVIKTILYKKIGDINVSLLFNLVHCCGNYEFNVILTIFGC